MRISNKSKIYNILKLSINFYSFWGDNLLYEKYENTRCEIT